MSTRAASSHEGLRLCVVTVRGADSAWCGMQAYEHEEASVNALGDVLGAFKRTVTLAASNFTSQ